MRFVPALAILAGCRGPDKALDDLLVTDAWLEDVELGSVAAIVGGQDGSGTLVVVDDAGSTHVFPVQLGGATFGVIFEGVAVDAKKDTTINLVGADEFPVPGRDLMRRYKGQSSGFALGIGVDDHQLHNRAGCQIDRGFFAVGISMFLGFEWLGIHTDGEGVAVEDTGDTDGADTGI
jgi:hypothetical protein